jgi:hypothetical protein
MVGMSSIAAGYHLLSWIFVFGAEERLAWRVRVSQVIAGVTR